MIDAWINSVFASRLNKVMLQIISFDSPRLLPHFSDHLPLNIQSNPQPMHRQNHVPTPHFSFLWSVKLGCTSQHRRKDLPLLPFHCNFSQILEDYVTLITGKILLRQKGVTVKFILSCQITSPSFQGVNLQGLCYHPWSTVQFAALYL